MLLNPFQVHKFIIQCIILVVLKSLLLLFPLLLKIFASWFNISSDSIKQWFWWSDSKSSYILGNLFKVWYRYGNNCFSNFEWLLIIDINLLNSLLTIQWYDHQLISFRTGLIIDINFIQYPHQYIREWFR